MNVQRTYLKSVLSLAAAASLLAVVGPASAAVFANGDFETGSVGGLPATWTYSSGGGGGTSLPSANLQTAIVSPFTNYYAASTQAPYLVDAVPDATPAGPQFVQDFDPVGGTTVVAWDFYIDETQESLNTKLAGTSGLFDLQMIGTSVLNPDQATNMGRMRLQNTTVRPEGEAAYNQYQLFLTGNDDIKAGISLRTWHQAAAILDFSTYTADMELYKWEGGAPVLVQSWTDLTLGETSGNAINIKRLQVGDTTTTAGYQGPNIVLDNIYVTVPEPTSLTLLGLGGLLGLIRPRRS